MDKNRQARIKREQESYDQGSVYEESTKLHSRFSHVFSCQNSAEAEKYFESKILENSSAGKVILDYGCYDGKCVPALLKNNPSRVVGIDISKTAIARARETHQYDNVDFFHMDAHETSFDNNTFDFIVGRGILHHLDYEIAIKELYRIVKPGGVVLFYEPLGDNPAAKIIRLLTPKARTPDEQALSRKQIKFADDVFGNQEHYFFNLFSVPSAMLTSLMMENPENSFNALTNQIDHFLARTPLRYWMRQVILCWIKK